MYNTDYQGKNFSFLGDSISTLEGYNPEGYNIFYNKAKCLLAGITGPDDTWWGRVIKHFGARLLVNNSYSGSRVAKMPHTEKLFYSGCSDERTSALHKDSEKPDVIVVYLGTNDWYNGASPECNIDIQILKDQSFRYAFNNMLTKLKRNYPEAEIWCCTLSISDVGESAEGFPYERMGVHMKVYCDIIKELANENGCRVIDIYSHLVPYDTVDGFHPSGKGMEALARIVIEEVEKE